MRFKLFILFSIFLLSIPALVLAAPANIVIYGDGNYPPYSYIDDGKPAGIYIDILKEAFKRMPDYNVSIKMEPWKRILRNIKQGNYFAAFPPYYRSSRTWMDPYSVPILDEEMCLYCREDVVGQKRTWPEGYYNLIFGNNAGFLPGDKTFRDAIAAGKVTIEECSSTQSNLLKLQKGRIQCYINDAFSVQHETKQLIRSGDFSSDHKIRMIQSISKEQGHLGYSKKFKASYKKDFIKKFDEVILNMKKEGAIETIQANFMM
ncbi:MAG: substrate-binding periplasmic protein [Desulfovibrio sp.]